MSDSIEVPQQFCPQCEKTTDFDARFCKHCAFDLSPPQSNQELEPDFYRDQTSAKSRVPFIVGGIALLIVIGCIALFAFFKLSGSSPSSNTNAAQVSATLKLGEKGLHAEEKILRGEALSPSDIESLTPNELRIVRNLHFAKYGRKYERPGLGDYFFTRPWYKPSDNYSEGDINATDKANIDLILSAEKSPNSGSDSTLATNPTTTTTPSPEVTQSSGSLTNSNVQVAVDSFMRGFTKGGNIIVEGIRELPNQNAATVPLRFSDWVCSTTYEGGLSKETPPPVTKDPYGMPSSTFGLRLRTYNTNGLAVLAHYNDGRWVLKEVRVGNGLNSVTVTGTQEIK